ncbi:dephospho-CoA kinase, partial [bacterium]
ARTAELSRRAGGRYQLIVIPLLAESGRRGDYDRVLVVDCPAELQVRRLVVRDGSSEAEARAILAAQASREARLAIADDVIANTGDLPGLARAVEDLHARYLALAASSG